MQMNKLILISMLVGSISVGQVPNVEDTQAGNSISWNGIAGRVYFIESSVDLKTWSFFTVVKSGAGLHTYVAPDNGEKEIFYRLQYTDSQSQDPLSEDFDGDGISSSEELQSNPQSNPLKLDSNDDGVDDGGLVDRDGDGIPTAWELANGFNPLVPNSDADLAYYLQLTSTSSTHLELHTPLK